MVQNVDYSFLLFLVSESEVEIIKTPGDDEEEEQQKKEEEGNSFQSKQEATGIQRLNFIGQPGILAGKKHAPAPSRLLQAGCGQRLISKGFRLFFDFKLSQVK